jgi:hypothetical protein
MEHLSEARRDFVRTMPSNGRDNIRAAVVRMIERNQHSKRKTGKFLGAALLWWAYTTPQPYGSRVLQRVKEGGSTIAFKIARRDETTWNFRVLLNPVQGAIQ